MRGEEERHRGNEAGWNMRGTFNEVGLRLGLSRHSQDCSNEQRGAEGGARRG